MTNENSTLTSVTQGAGLKLNNPLNLLIMTSRQAPVKVNGGYTLQSFRTMTDGCTAAVLRAVNIITGRDPQCLHRRYDQLGWFLTKWLPTSDVDPVLYVRRICEITGYNEYKKLYPVQKHILCYVLWAMAQVECGEVVPLHYFENGFSVAFGGKSNI